jgi:hypothetical protein
VENAAFSEGGRKLHTASRCLLYYIFNMMYGGKVGERRQSFEKSIKRIFSDRVNN